MSMFDNRLSERIVNWGTSWGTKDRTFRERVVTETSIDYTVVRLKLYNGNRTDFLRMTAEDWESGVRKPAMSCRVGNTHAVMFFLYHWLEERNLLPNLFKQLEESRNA